MPVRTGVQMQGEHQRGGRASGPEAQDMQVRQVMHGAGARGPDNPRQDATKRQRVARVSGEGGGGGQGIDLGGEVGEPVSPFQVLRAGAVEAELVGGDERAVDLRVAAHARYQLAERIGGVTAGRSMLRKTHGWPSSAAHRSKTACATEPDVLTPTKRISGRPGQDATSSTVRLTRPDVTSGTCPELDRRRHLRGEAAHRVITLTRLEHAAATANATVRTICPACPPAATRWSDLK